MVDLFSSTFGRFLLLYNFIPKMNGNDTFSYIVSEMSNNHPDLDCSSHPILDDNFIINNHPYLDCSNLPLLDDNYMYYKIIVQIWIVLVIHF